MSKLLIIQQSKAFPHIQRVKLKMLINSDNQCQKLYNVLMTYYFHATHFIQKYEYNVRFQHYTVSVMLISLILSQINGLKILPNSFFLEQLDYALLYPFNGTYTDIVSLLSVTALLSTRFPFKIKICRPSVVSGKMVTGPYDA